MQFDIVAVLAFAFGSWIQFEDYTGPDGKKMDLVSGIVLGLMAMIRLVDLVDGLRKKKYRKVENEG